jgi:circadian clock protein KaiC
MGESKKVGLKLLSTGVPGLDEVLGGGLPEYSFNLIAGPPGVGKTTLIQQLAFANASAERPALYFTVLGEPAVKMLRYQQQMSFFEPDKIGTAIRLVDLSQDVLGGAADAVLEKIVQTVKQVNPSIVVVDSFRTMIRTNASLAGGRGSPEAFLQRLGLYLASWQITSFLIGEYGEGEMQDNPVLTVADGILWLSRSVERNSVVRKLEVMKVRGLPARPGLHTFRISSNGVEVFPRISAEVVNRTPVPRGTRATFGVQGLDEMLNGGLPAGDATLLAGPSGTGKSVLCTHFIAAGAERGEASVLAIFEEHPADYIARAADLGFDLAAMVAEQKLKIIYLRPLDLSPDEILGEIKHAVAELDAKRLVIDSLNGVEVALAPTFREDFRESLYALVGHLTATGVTVLLTVEVMESVHELKFSPHAISFLAHSIIFMRYLEIEGQLRKMLTVVKMRRSAHSRDLREYELTSEGIRILKTLREYRGILTGSPMRALPPPKPPFVALTQSERSVYEALLRFREASAEALSSITGIDADALPGTLGRLAELGYVTHVVEGAMVLYRAQEYGAQEPSPPV